MWEISVYNQILTFAWSLVLGALWCFTYDIICSMRRVYVWARWIVFISDVLLWVIYAFVTFIFLISRTNGEIRSYVLLGEILGFLVFRIVASRFVVMFFVFIFTKVKKICNQVKRVFYATFEKLEQIVLKSLQNTSNFLILSVKTAKKLLQYMYKLLYTKRNSVNVENKLDETKTKT